MNLTFESNSRPFRMSFDGCLMMLFFSSVFAVGAGLLPIENSRRVLVKAAVAVSKRLPQYMASNWGNLVAASQTNGLIPADSHDSFRRKNYLVTQKNSVDFGLELGKLESTSRRD
jgi:hypothetical protein